MAAFFTVSMLHIPNYLGWSAENVTNHPEIALGILLLAFVYALGVGPLRRRYHLADRIQRRYIVRFSLGMVAMIAAVLSPLHNLSEDFLFSAHMVQHLLLLLVVAPLLVTGIPGWLLRPLIRPRIVAALVRFFVHPLVAFVLFNIVLIIWHIPPIYDDALANDLFHALEHLSLLACAVLVWWPIFSPLSEMPRLSPPLQLLYLFLLGVVQTPLFAMITFSSRVLYQSYVDAPPLWGLSPLADQILGGVLMKVGGMSVFFSLTVFIFFKWFNREEAQDRWKSEGANSGSSSHMPPGSNETLVEIRNEK